MNTYWIDPNDPDVIILELTQKQETRINRRWLELVLQHRWYAMLDRKSGNWYAVTMVTVNGRRRKLKLSRLILGLDFGDKRQAHHVDGNSLNDVDSNLQILSSSHHQFTKLQATNQPTTKIYVTKWGTYRRQSFRAEDGTKIGSKTFKTLEEAIQNRDILLSIHRPNFPLPGGAL